MIGKTQRHKDTKAQRRGIKDFHSRASVPLCLCAFVFLIYVAVLPALPQGPTQRLVAIGDIHGDLDAFVGILQRAQLIDPIKRWSGGHATLVQTGDFLDRGPKARGVMDLLMSLQKDAARQGGRVIVLMGNHEAMNIFGDFRYVTNNDYISFEDERARKRKPDTTQTPGFLERCEALGPNGKYGKWLRSLPAIARVNDSIFLHGGISPELASYSIDQLNDGIATEIKTFDTYKQFLVDKKLAQPCSTLEELTNAARTALDKAKGKDAEILKGFLGYGAWLSINDNGPLWFRGYAQWTDAEGAPQIQRLTETFSVARFVVGHTPQAGGEIGERFNGKVYLIDTGMLSSYYRGGRASALIIQDGKVTTIY
jgi:Calcineurin-like phosphoesterase